MKFFSVFPNPASEKITLSFSNQLQIKNAEVMITDVVGKKLLQLCLRKSDHTKSVDVSFLENGIYFVTVIVGEEKVVRKFLINRR